MWLKSLYYLKKNLELLTDSRESIEEFQSKRIESVLNKCRSADFYRDIEFSDERLSKESLEKFPRVKNSEITQENVNSLIIDDAGEKVFTSGMTGTRLGFVHDHNAADWMTAAYLRNLILNDYRFRMKIVQYGDIERERSYLGKKLIPIKYVKTDYSLEKQLEILQKEDPDVIDYFPQVLLSLSKFINRSDEENCLDIEMIFTRGELLTESTRNYIEDTFNAPIKDNYAASEFGTIGWECDDGGYHLAEDMIYPEISNLENDTGNGELIVTGLINKAMPLVRYSTGDVVAVENEDCSCNTDFIRIKGIRGRKKNLISNKSGKNIYPDQIIDILGPEEDILFYQLSQKGDTFLVKYVPNEDFDSCAIKRVSRKLEKLGIKPLNFKQIKSLDKSIGGKLRIMETSGEKN